ncbi:GntR family transcriptional regulator [Pararoseomonas indoligenes]|uniref:GntR family transcriptional regulator n=1 Tax=Roseomonas indoligenes TaxID=2820811 RepID=A0A940N350_9PROT|nr:GntR family transcriptional regulator [Pararoseomonas indoligenes]MBP0495151.1 GntR family transcriptional regulator [Pararoseomonas indoligenes]
MKPDLPLYRAVLDGLHEDLRNGRLPVGAALPSEKELCERFGVSRITVRRAMDTLAQEGLIHRSAGRAARVAEPRLVQAVAAFEDSSGPLRLVRGTRVELLGFEWQLADGAVARALGIEEGDQVLRIARLRRQEEAPVFHTVTYLPAEIGAAINRRALEESALQEVLAAAGFIAAGTERQMGAAPCPKAVAALLGLRTGAPTFRTERLTRDATARPLHLMIGHWRWDRFAMRLVSAPTEGGNHLTVSEMELGACLEGS